MVIKLYYNSHQPFYMVKCIYLKVLYIYQPSSMQKSKEINIDGKLYFLVNDSFIYALNHKQTHFQPFVYNGKNGIFDGEDVAVINISLNCRVKIEALIIMILYWSLFLLLEFYPIYRLSQLLLLFNSMYIMVKGRTFIFLYGLSGIRMMSMINIYI